MAVSYEWNVMRLDEHGDIIDNEFYDRLNEMGCWMPHELLQGSEAGLCLVRNEGSNDEGLQDRHWAYPKDGNLPDYFDESMLPIPKKFRVEFLKWNK